MATKIQTVKELLDLEKEHTAEIKKQDKELDRLYKKQQGQMNSRHRSRAEATQKEIDDVQQVIKEREKEIPVLKKALDISKDEISVLQDHTKNIQKSVLAGIDLGALSREQLTSTVGIAELEKEILGNKLNVGTEEYKHVDVAKVLREERQKLNVLEKTGQTNAAIMQRQMVGSLETLEATNQKQKLQNKILNDQNDLIDQSVQSIASFAGKIPLVGGMLEKHLINSMDKFKESMKESLVGKDGMSKGMLAGLGVAGLVVGALISIANKAKEAGLGMSQLGDPKIGAALLVNSDMVSQMAEDFGHINDASATLGLTMKKNAMVHGIATKDSVKILRLQQATTSLSNEELISRQQATAQLAKQAGIPVGKLMEDVANSAEFFALNAQDGGDNIARAAIEAKKLGLNLSVVEKVQESLLDLESSLQAQMEAQVLIGRDLNFDRARQLALTGDVVGLMQEVVRQAGGEAEFARLNFIERKKFAQAFGLTGAELAKTISGTGGATTPTLHTGGKVTKSGPVSLQRGEVVYNQGQQDALMGALKKVEKAINSQTVDAKDNTRKQINATRSVGVSTG